MEQQLLPGIFIIFQCCLQQQRLQPVLQNSRKYLQLSRRQPCQLLLLRLRRSRTHHQKLRCHRHHCHHLRLQTALRHQTLPARHRVRRTCVLHKRLCHSNGCCSNGCKNLHCFFHRKLPLSSCKFILHYFNIKCAALKVQNY